MKGQMVTRRVELQGPPPLIVMAQDGYISFLYDDEKDISVFEHVTIKKNIYSSVRGS